jgi:hypothetical protein
MIASHPLRTLNAWVFYISCSLLLVSCWQRNEFPADLQVDPVVLTPPVQRAVEAPPVLLEQEDIRYRIEPQYFYDLKGLVVSYAHHDGNYSLHRLWSDHLNVADVCVVWGDNATGIDLNRLDFWNGKFTCNFETRDPVTWEKFRADQISNNHLLTVDPAVRRAIEQVRIGDQVRIRGWLAQYSNDRGFSRGTSTTREDRGNGACETILVQQFSVLESMDNGWRTLLSLSLTGVLVSSLIWLVAVLRGVF